MIATPPPARTAQSPASLWLRGALLALLCIALAFTAASDTVHAELLRLLAAVEVIIARHPVEGATLFFVLAALSAMLAFFSSAMIVPVGVYAWGKPGCLLLLWGGWFVGGLCAYAIGRYLGRPVVAALTSADTLERYQRRVSAHAPFRLVLLFQLALPSEVPGYLLGIARYSPAKFAAALALAELPFAVGTVYLSESFLERRIALLLGLCALGIGFSIWAGLQLHRRLRD
ncbi:MAG TPA: VTT domain-containing protein [Gemmatimonadaceae bacterium]|nr:VTT domain-containing protein [Gemmatimonadaceae bacterium]